MLTSDLQSQNCVLGKPWIMKDWLISRLRRRLALLVSFPGELNALTRIRLPRAAANFAVDNRTIRLAWETGIQTAE